MSRGGFPALIALTLTLAALQTGCTTQERADDLRNTNSALVQRVEELENSFEAERARADAAEAEARAARGDAANRARNAEAALQQALRDNEALMARLNNMDITVLPPELDEAIRQLVAQYPDLLSYDAARGMIRLKSDVTFPSGSDQVRSEAQASLRSLASVLQSAVSQGFEVTVVGHTDNVPISKPETRAAHPTNMHLSAHRAISVRSLLVSSGVPAASISAAGWGEYRPAVPNRPGTAGTPENRRVEIYLRPAVEASSGETQAPQQDAAPARDEEPMK